MELIYSEVNLAERAQILLDHIQAECSNNEKMLGIAIENIKALTTSLKTYSLAPRYYNAIFEDSDNHPGAAASSQEQSGPLIPSNHGANDNNNTNTNNNSENNNDAYSKRDLTSMPVSMELEKIYGRKLKQVELQKIAKLVAAKEATNLGLSRDIKRSKVLLLQWFEKFWNFIHPKIYELNINRLPLPDTREL